MNEVPRSTISRVSIIVIICKFSLCFLNSLLYGIYYGLPILDPSPMWGGLVCVCIYIYIYIYI